MSSGCPPLVASFCALVVLRRLAFATDAACRRASLPPSKAELAGIAKQREELGANPRPAERGEGGQSEAKAGWGPNASGSRWSLSSPTVLASPLTRLAPSGARHPLPADAGRG